MFARHGRMPHAWVLDTRIFCQEQKVNKILDLLDNMDRHEKQCFGYWSGLDLDKIEFRETGPIPDPDPAAKNYTQKVKGILLLKDWLFS